MTEAGDDLPHSQGRRSTQGLRLLDHGREVGDTIVVGVKVRDSGETGDTGGIDAVGIGRLGSLDDSAGDDDGTVKSSVIGLLSGRRTTVVSGKMVEAGQVRVAVGRHEFVMGVDFNAGALSLFQKALESADVSAGNQNTGLGTGTQFNVGQFRRAVTLDAGVVEKAHRTVAKAAHFHGKVEEQTDAERELQSPLQDSLQEGVDPFVFIADLISFPGIGRNAFEAGEDDLPQAVGVSVLPFLLFDFFELCFIFFRAGGVPQGIDGEDPGRSDLGEEFSFQGQSLVDGRF